jgi:hypothetical protein
VPSRVKFNYEAGPAGVARPYLKLDLRADAGRVPGVLGLLDTGADVTLLDNAYLSALGISGDELEAVVLDEPSGKVTGQRSTQAVHASLPGAPRSIALLHPIFIDAGGDVRWGRDFMATFAVGFHEQAKQFSLYSKDLDSTPLRES